MKKQKPSKNFVSEILLSNEIFLFDTHCHLSDESYSDEEVYEIIKKPFFESKRNFVLNVGCDLISNERLIKQSKFFPSNVYCAIGIHPNSEKELNDSTINWLEEKIIDGGIIAVGEIGLDYYRNSTVAEKQKIFFKKQVSLAKKYNLPVLLHLRDKGDFSAFYDAILIIKEVGWNKGLVHCFSGNYEIARKFTDIGFYISFSGTVTFKNNRIISETVLSLPLDKVLVETDSPYLSPIPFRGKKNYPWRVFYILEFLSSILKISIFDLSLIFFHNSLRLLDISLESKKTN